MSEHLQNELFNQLHQAGVLVGLRNGCIAFGGDPNALPADVKASIKENLQALNDSVTQGQKQSDYAWKQRVAQADLTLTDIAASGSLIKRSPLSTATEKLDHLVLTVHTENKVAGDDLDALLRAAWAVVLQRYSGTNKPTFLTARGLENIGTEGEPQAVLNPFVDEFNICADSTFDEVAAIALETRKAIQGEGSPSQKLLEKSLLSAGGDLSLLISRAELAQRKESISVFFELAARHFVYVVDASKQGNTIVLNLYFDAQRSTHLAAQRIGNYYANVIHAFFDKDSSARAISQHDFLSKGERSSLLNDLAGAEINLPKNLCISHLFASQVEKTPSAACLDDSVDKLNYREVSQRVDALIGVLTAVGVQRGHPVAVFMPKSVDLVVATLAIMKMGCAYLPIDKSVPPERIKNIFQSADVRFALTDSAERKLCLENLSLPNSLRVLQGAELNQLCSVDTNSEFAIACSQEDTAYIIYTSGSTGSPKGVAVSHRALTSFLLHCQQAYSAEELRSVLFSTRICFDLSIFELFAAFLFGGKLVIVEDILELVDREDELDVSFIGSVPSVMTQLLDIKDLPPSACTLNLGGEPLRKSLVHRVFKQSQITRLHNVYGPTESTVFSTTSLLQGPEDSEPVIGRPVGNTLALVLDQNGNLLPQGVIGELFLAGLNTASCYVNSEALTAERFIKGSKYFDAVLMYRTGDFVRWNDKGELEFIGRIDQQIKLRGFRIEIDEIEVALAALPEVLEGAVVLQRNEHTGDKLLAYVTLDKSVKQDLITSASILKTLARSLPEYMVPAKCLVLERMPNTASGKIDRKSLAALSVSDTDPLAKTPPATALQKQLCRAFEQTLNIDGVGIEDDFFALGGHSLMIGKLVRKIGETTQIKLPLRSIFDHSRIDQLESYLQTLQNNNTAVDIVALSASLPLGRISDAEASYAQQAYWYKADLNKSTSEYNLAFSFCFSGKLNETALRTAYASILKKHDALRTVLYEGSDGIRQRVLENYALPFHKLKFPVCENQERSRFAARELIEQQADLEFDLARDCPTRLVILPISEREHFVLLVVHHSAADGVAVANIFRELEQAYVQEINGLTPAPEASVLQFANYATWQRNWLTSSQGVESIRYWQNKLKDLPVLHSLPTDFLRPAKNNSEGLIWRSQIPAELAAKFKSVLASRSASLFMGTQALYAWLLASVSGVNDLVMGTPSAGRESEELEVAVGNFMNTVILRNRIQTQTGFSELLDEVKASVLAAFDHQRVPVELLNTKLSHFRDASFNPLYQIWFVMQNQEKEISKFADLDVVGLEQNYTEKKYVHFDLSLSISEVEGNLELYWGYKPALFKESTIAKLAESYLCVMEQIVQNPEAQMPSTLIDFLPTKHYLSLQNGTNCNPPQIKERLSETLVSTFCDLKSAEVQVQDSHLVITLGDDCEKHQLKHAFKRLAGEICAAFPEYLRDIYLLPLAASSTKSTATDMVRTLRELAMAVEVKSHGDEKNIVRWSAAARIDLYLSAIFLSLRNCCGIQHFDLFVQFENAVDVHRVLSAKTDKASTKISFDIADEMTLAELGGQVFKALGQTATVNEIYICNSAENLAAKLYFEDACTNLDFGADKVAKFLGKDFKADVSENMNLLESTAYITVKDMAKYAKSKADASIQNLKSRFW